MRTALVLVASIVGGALLLPAAESKSLPLDGMKLVAETRAPLSELAAGKNATKNGSGGNKNSNGGGGSTGGFAVAKGGFGGFGTSFAGRDLPENDGELVAVDIR